MQKPCTVHLYLVLFLVWPFLSSCGSKPPGTMLPADSDIAWAAEPGGIVLKFGASGDLNMDRGRPSSLSVCVYQLSDTRVFEQLREEGREGLAALAACKKFSDAVLAASRYFLEPGQRLEPLFVNRREGAKFVGVAAGYYHLESGRCIRLFPVPVIQVKDGWFRHHREPGQLIIELDFGPDWPETPVAAERKE